MAQDAELELSKLRQYYRDIIWGYSVSHYQNRKIFVKHFTAIDQAIIDQEKDIFLKDALREGLLDENQTIENLKVNDLWPENLDKDIYEKRSYLDLRIQTKRNLYLQSHIREANVQIEELQKEVNNLLMQRDILLGFTAEKYAYKKINERYVFNSLFADSELKVSFFNPEDFDELSKNELDNVVSFYNKITYNFSTNKIRHIGLHDFFQNIFTICDSDVFKFYGKPVCLLTYYQQEMFYYGNLFHHILQKDRDKIPSDIKKDPDKIIDYFMGNQNAKKILDKHDGDIRAAGIVGGTREDYKALGVTDQELDAAQVKYKELTKTPGKSMSWQEMLKQNLIPVSTK